MYTITKTNGDVLGITESPTYIKLHPNGGFTLAGEADAIGVAYRSTPYNLMGHNAIDGADTVIVSMMDGGNAAEAVSLMLGGLHELGCLAVQFRRAVRLFAESLDDADALSVASVYDEWASGVDYNAGQHLRWKGNLYRVTQPHPSQADWTPDVAVSLYERIDVEHAGTMDDPIPYEGNMALVVGLHYVQDGVVYLCTRDTVNPVYNPLAELVGIYVKEVQKQ